MPKKTPTFAMAKGKPNIPAPIVPLKIIATPSNKEICRRKTPL